MNLSNLTDKTGLVYNGSKISNLYQYFKMPEVTKTRELSILTKTPTHYLVKYTGSKTYKVRIRDLFRLKGEVCTYTFT